MANKIIPAIQTNEGNVGIGTTNPAEKLEVSGYILNRSKFGYTQRNDIVKNGLSFYVDFNNKTCFDPIVSATSIKDISNNNYALTLVNAATISNKDGNTALYTANNSSYLQIASYVMALPHTWEAWVNGDAFGTGGSGWDTIWDSNTERPLIGVINGVLNVYPNTNNCGTLTAGKWYHIVVTADASSNIVTFINGVQTASFAYVSIFATGTRNIWLGGDVSAETFNGYIPIARTYNRVLSSVEVMQNYNAEKWRFDNASTFYHNVADGKVGIGTVSPASILNTVGAGDQVIRFAHSDNVAGRTVTLRLTNNNSTYADAGVYIQAIEGAGIDSYAMAFGTTTAAATTSTTKMLLDNAGKLGIGTTNPIASLEVDNTAANLPVLNLGGGEAGNNVSDLYVLNSYNNNTGVGYAAKVIGVNISSSLTSQNIPLQRTTWGGVTSATAIALGTDGPRAGTQDNAFQIWTTNDGVAGTSLTQKFSLTSAGDVGIGTVAPAQKLDVNGAVVLGVNNSYGAYTRTPGGVLKPWFATATANTFFYNTNLSGSIFWQNAADTATLMSLTEQGRLGVNTNDPSGRLHVLDTVLYPPSLTWNAAAATIIRSENGQIAFGSDNTTPYGIWQQVRTSSSTARPLLLNPLGGNVGVGVRNPTKKLQVAGSLYWDYNGTATEEHSVGIQRVVAAANGSFTEIGTLAASASSIRATFEIFHHDNATIEYSLFELIANYYTGTTTDWVQLPSRTQAHYAGVANGVVVDARLQTTGGSVELRLRSIGGAGGNMTVNVRIKSNTNLTETSATGTGATVAGLLGFNGYEFPVTNNRFKATTEGLFIKNNGNIGIGTTNPTQKLDIVSSYGAPDDDGGMLKIRGTGVGPTQLNFGVSADGGYGWIQTTDIGASNERNIILNPLDGNVGIGTTNPLSLLGVGAAGSTSAANGLTFGQDAQANLYRSAEDTIKTDGALTVAGLIYNNNSAYYSSVTKTAASNWGQYSTILGNNSYSSQIVQVLVNGGNISWAGTFLVSNNISFRPNETWGSVKLLEYANYNCGADDVSLLIASNFPTTGFGSTALVLKTNGTINGGLGTGLANNITVTVNSPSPSSVNLSNSWTNPYPYQIATSVNTKQIYVNENGNVGVGTTTSTYKLNVNGGQFGTSLKGGDLGAGSEVVRMIKSDDTYAMVVRGDGNVGINTSSPSVRLDVVGTARLSANLLSHKVASYTTSYPGINSFGANATDSNITYYDTGKALPNTNFRGVVWTGKHYIFTDYVNYRAYFYDNNFNQITNAYGYYYVTLPLPGGGYNYTHGAAWDGRYLWVVVYTGSNSKIIGYDLDTTNQTATIIAESAALSVPFTYDIEYADGHLYLVYGGGLYIYKWNGSSIDLISSYAGAAGAIEAQAITYDGSYLWVTQNGAYIYKVGLDGTPIATITSGFPPNTCGWAWNGSNIVSFDFTNRNIFIINTTRLRIDTQNLALMGGRVGIGITNPGDRVQANLAAGESILANIISNAVSASNKIGFKLSELGTASAEFSLVRDGTSYQAKLQTLNNQPLSFGTSGVTRMVINGSFVGIGSTAPTALLNVRSSIPTSIGATPAGTNVLLDSNTSNYITFRNTADNGTYAGLVFLDNNVGGYVAFGNAGAAVGSDSMIYGAYQDHIFQNNYVNENLYNRTETLRIKQNGNVGIGVTNPTQKLDIVGSYAAPDDDAGILKIRGAGVGPTQLNFGISADGGYAWIQATDIAVSNEKNIILGPLGGNVGIGTTNPLSLLGVGAAGSTTAANGITLGGDASANLYRDSSASIRTDGGFLAAGRIRTLDYIQFNTNLYPNTFTNFIDINIGNLAANNWQSAIRINPGGYVGIGTTVPSGKLHVNSTVVGETVLRADGTNGTLFSVVDDLSDSLMSVNNSAGLPVLEVFANDRVVMGQYGANDFVLLNNKIGLGTNNPQYELDIVGAGTNAAVNIITRMRSTAGSDVFDTASVIAFTNTTTNSNAYSYIGSRIDLGSAGDNAQSLVFATNATNTLPTEKMRIKSDGTVGIGTTNPSWLLTTYAAVAPQFALSNATRSFVLTNNAGDDLLSFNYASLNRLQFSITSQWFNIGNFGIGTSSPYGPLHVFSSSGRYINYAPNTTSGLLIQRNASISSQGTTVLTLINAQGPETLTNRGTSLNLDIGYGGALSTAGSVARGARIAALNSTVYDATAANQNAYLAFYTATGGTLTEKVRIQADGNVGIGTTNSETKLQVNGEVRIASSSSFFTHLNYLDGGSNYITTANGGATYFRGSSNTITSMAVDGGGTVNTYYNTYLALTNGNVGISTTVPAQKLDVRGYVVSDVNSNSVAGGFFLGNNSHGMRREAGSNDVRFHTNGGDLIFGAAGSGSQQVTLKNGGNVGIGSATPGTKLDVAGNINIDGSSFHRVANDSIIAAPSDHGLVAYYGFDEGSSLLISDKTGRNNTYAAGSLTFTTTAIRGTALDGFGSDSNHVVIPDSADFDFGTGDFAVSLWCRPNSSFTNSLNTLMEIGLYTAGMLIRPHSNTLEIYIQSSLITNPALVWTANTWYHIVVTRVNSVLNVYSNGTRISSVANTSNIQVASAGYIGRSAHASGQFFYGIIDEVKIYKGKGLDYGEVRGQYLSRGDSTLIAPIFSTTNGNVGIGASTPAYKLDVRGQTFIYNGANNALLIQTTVADGNTRDGIYLYENDAQGTGRQAISWYNGNQSYYKARLWTEVGSSYAATTFGIDVADDARTVATRLAIRNGNVGIGTTTPVGKLDVYDDTNAGHVSFVRNFNAGSNAYTAIVLRRNGGNNGLVMFTNSSARTTDGGASNSTIRTDNGKLLLGSNGTTYHALETDGNVGIGLTNPVAARLHIKGDGSNPVLRVESALLAGAAGGTAGKTFVGWMPIQTGALSPADTVYIPLYK